MWSRRAVQMSKMSVVSSVMMILRKSALRECAQVLSVEGSELTEPAVRTPAAGPGVTQSGTCSSDIEDVSVLVCDDDFEKVCLAGVCSALRLQLA